MRKRMKRALVGVMTASMAFGLTACGSTSSDSAPAESSGSASAEAGESSGNAATSVFPSVQPITLCRQNSA